MCKAFHVELQQGCAQREQLEWNSKGGKEGWQRARIEEKRTFADSTSNPNSAYYNTLSNNNQAAIEDIQEQQMIGPQTKRPHNPDM